MRILIVILHHKAVLSGCAKIEPAYLLQAPVSDASGDATKILSIYGK